MYLVSKWCVGRESNPLHGVLEAPLVPNEFQRMIQLYSLIAQLSTILDKYTCSLLIESLCGPHRVGLER